MERLLMTTKSKEHDFTHGVWGHNLNILRWDRELRTGRAVCWVTPGIKDGDIVIVKSENGSMRLGVSNVQRMPNVDDMYGFDVDEIAEIPDDGLWVAKVQRNDGRYSILDVSSKENVQALVDEFNEQYQTDNYSIEKYDPDQHTYSRHG